MKILTYHKTAFKKDTEGNELIKIHFRATNANTETGNIDEYSCTLSHSEWFKIETAVNRLRIGK